jgi:hypothetical protein
MRIFEGERFNVVAMEAGEQEVTMLRLVDGEIWGHTGEGTVWLMCWQVEERPEGQKVKPGRREAWK